ncbi:flagellar biosynthesis protein FlhF [Dasania sp. GY-MA-18]|uniref:Flagellar biosynthesis protein FlhF n=1 Tax=Dasania phycosphaerae TaxID=2950436 RepID=A0A9J6RJF4_9GAMM|nr:MULTISPECIES: flagellar biosynthesis protein FlhF [Dasania]MCR8921673.1 flagellar biosynthesis protein FlhF [Dasania sp. GY-MA-18]MCZ0864101.1 flagellar biosynthesis protein FlhF [Dasania phycosphaerae]MCZ0867829.1 flagellar biosynthesis protein FlhF [Dasania phycosphaerae]
MQLKRFVAPSMSQALKKVREEVGADAVILSNKRVAEGIELVTAIDRPDPDDNGVFPADMQPHAQPKKAQPKQVSKLEQEVDRMQNQAKQRAAALAATLGRSEQNKFAAAMQQQGFDPQLNQPQTPAANEIGQLQQAEQNKQAIQEAVAAAVQEYTQSQQKTSATEDPQVLQMRSELQSMRQLLEQQLSSMAWGQFASSEPEKASLWRRLKRMGLEAKVANQLLEGLSELGAQKHVWMQLMQRLSRQLPVVGQDLIDQQGVFVFVGPTGAGKTTSIGKLAARYVMAHGADSLALVTTDTFRIAAHEQLRTLGRILNVPVKVVDKNNPLDRVLHGLRHKQLVLVDTAGLTHQDERLIKQAQAINELAAKVKTILVLPTTSQPRVLRAAYHHYKTDNLAACILTKLDESASLGECISLSVEKALPIAYSTHGQNIPEDIAIAEPVSIVRQAIELAKDQQVDDEDMSAELQALIS